MNPMEDIMRNLVLLGLAAGFMASCGKKAPAAPIIVEGWHKEEGWRADLVTNGLSLSVCG